MLYETVSLFLVLYQVFFIFINLLKPDVPCALKKDYLTIAFQVSESLMRHTKELHFFNYCSHKNNKYLVQIIDL